MSTVAERRRSRRERAERDRALKLAMRPDPDGIVATAERLVEERDAERERARVKPARRTTTLELLYDRGSISGEQADAGRWLYQRWYTAGRSPRVVTLLGGIRGNTPMTEAQLDAWREFNEAVGRMAREAGQMAAHVTVGIAVYEDQVTGVARSWGIGTRRVVTLLRAGLDVVRG